MPFELEHLATIGPIEILLQFAAEPEGALLQPPMPLVDRASGARITGAHTKARHALFRLEERLDRLSGVGLIVFEGPDMILLKFVT